MSTITQRKYIMDIKDFVSKFKTHPVLFIGSGLSKRYLKGFPTWDELLSSISQDVWNTDEVYLRIADKHNFNYAQIGSDIEDLFEKYMDDNRHGKHKQINDKYFEILRKTKTVGRFKLLISEVFSKMEYNHDQEDEITLFKELSRKIKSIVTTNYDQMIEHLTIDFNVLIGNNILLTSQYGSIYKMHGCCSTPESIVITQSDYDKFKEQGELIRAHLISLFIHSPIIFLGYGVNDDNVNDTLTTIFKYVGDNDEVRKKISDNFLLVEYKEGSTNTKVESYHKKLSNGIDLALNSLKTDDYSTLYKSLINIPYPIEAGQLRLLEDFMQRPVSSNPDNSNQIKIYCQKDYESIKSTDYIVAILEKNKLPELERIIEEKHIISDSTVDLITSYFTLEEADKMPYSINGSLKVNSTVFFPVFLLANKGELFDNLNKLKKQQERNLNNINPNTQKNLTGNVNKKIRNKAIKIIDYGKQVSIDAILRNRNIAKSAKSEVILYNVLERNISLDDLKAYLQTQSDLTTTENRKFLCAYDYFKYK